MNQIGGTYMFYHRVKIVKHTPVNGNLTTMHVSNLHILFIHIYNITYVTSARV